MRRLAAILALPLVAGGLACSKSEPPPPPTPVPVTAPPPTAPAPVSVSAVNLGKSVGADKKITGASETFGKKDTIYASVETAGTGHAKLRALWSFVKGAKTAKVDETTMEYDASGPATNEFHISKPSGWPVGEYKVEIFLGDAGSPAMAKSFKVG